MMAAALTAALVLFSQITNINNNAVMAAANAHNVANRNTLIAGSRVVGRATLLLSVL